MNLWIDRALLPVFVGVVWTGVALHVAGRVGIPSVVQSRMAWHIAVSLLFLLLAGFHVRMHWGWYRALRTVGCEGRHRWMVLLFSLVFLLAAVSGLLLLLCGAALGAGFGIFHYLLGLLFGIMALLHILKRLHLLLGLTGPGSGKSR